MELQRDYGCSHRVLGLLDSTLYISITLWLLLKGLLITTMEGVHNGMHSMGTSTTDTGT